MHHSLFNKISSKVLSLFKGEISYPAGSEGENVIRLVHLPVGHFFTSKAQANFTEPSFIHQKHKITC